MNYVVAVTKRRRNPKTYLVTLGTSLRRVTVVTAYLRISNSVDYLQEFMALQPARRTTAYFLTTFYKAKR